MTKRHIFFIMKTQTRKQKDFEERNQLILDVGRRMLIEKGYLGLNMERIAEDIGYSKGTVYNHFCCKEDLVGGLMIETLVKIREMIIRAVRIEGSTREKMTAVGLVLGSFLIRHPEHLKTYELMRVSSLREKVSHEKLDSIHDLHHELISLIEKLMDQAIAKGDLSLPGPDHKDRIIAAGWSLAIGSYMIFSDVDDRHIFPGVEFSSLFPEALQVLMDGLGWKPLSSERDHNRIVDAKLLKEGIILA